MKKPWTLRLQALGSGRIAYTKEPPRFWTRKAADAEAVRLNKAAEHLPVFWYPVRTWKDAW